MKITVLEIYTDPMNTTSLVFQDGFCSTHISRFKKYKGESLRRVRTDLDKNGVKYREISYPETNNG